MNAQLQTLLDAILLTAANKNYEVLKEGNTHTVSSPNFILRVEFIKDATGEHLYISTGKPRYTTGDGVLSITSACWLQDVDRKTLQHAGCAYVNGL